MIVGAAVLVTFCLAKPIGAYQMGEAFCLPVLTHKTKAAERRDFLERFRKGEYPVLLTSKVLNEGVDVPEASVGIVVSGSGSIREHGDPYAD